LFEAICRGRSHGCTSLQKERLEAHRQGHRRFIHAGTLVVNYIYLYYLATLTASLATLDGDEQFEASLLGTAEEVVQERISDDELIMIKGPKARSCASIILRFDHLINLKKNSPVFSAAQMM
jgi:hypothetical protein